MKGRTFDITRNRWSAQISTVGDTTEEINGWSIAPVAAAIFGSAARGTMCPDSDIDVFLVRPDDADEESWGQQVSDLCVRMTRWTGNDTRSLEFGQTELNQAAASGTAIVKEIWDDGIWLVGTRRVLAGQRALRSARKDEK